MLLICDQAQADQCQEPTSECNTERVHQVITTMLCTTDLDMANTVVTSDINAYLTDAAWAIHSTYHTVLKASPGAAIFGWDTLYDTSSFLTDWNKIGDHRQFQTYLLQGLSVWLEFIIYLTNNL